jgi:uncharacterized protein with beta-barrel porin domain
MGITPCAAAQFTTFALPAYAEQALVGTNTFALSYGAKTVTDPRTERGLRADRSFALQNGALTLRGRPGAASNFTRPRRPCSGLARSAGWVMADISGATC